LAGSIEPLDVAGLTVLLDEPPLWLEPVEPVLVPEEPVTGVAPAEPVTAAVPLVGVLVPLLLTGTPLDPVLVEDPVEGVLVAEPAGVEAPVVEPAGVLAETVPGTEVAVDPGVAPVGSAGSVRLIGARAWPRRGRGGVRRWTPKRVRTTGWTRRSR
jgi:hypothetical protein